MNVLENTLNRYATSLNLSKSESTIRVVRVQLNDGERVVGVRFPKLLIKEVEKAMKDQKLFETNQQQMLMNSYLNADRLVLSQMSSSQLMSSQTVPSLPSPLRAVDVTLPSSSPLTIGHAALSGSPMASGSAIPSISSSQSLPTQSTNVSTNSHIDLTDDKRGLGEAVLANGKVGSIGTSSVVKADPPSPVKTIVETVANVSSKCLSKAMRPPVTIKSFFNVSASSPKIDKNVTKETRNEISQNSAQESTDSKGKTSEMNYEDFLNQQSALEKKTNESETGVDKSANKCAKYSDKVIKSETQSVNVSETTQQKTFAVGSRKRANDDDSSSRPIKKAKQATLFSAFQKMTTKKEKEEKKSPSCPVCGTEFDKGISNVDLNKHIDNCIIE